MKTECVHVVAAVLLLVTVSCRDGDKSATEAVKPKVEMQVIADHFGFKGYSDWFRYFENADPGESRRRVSAKTKYYSRSVTDLDIDILGEEILGIMRLVGDERAGLARAESEATSFSDGMRLGKAMAALVQWVAFAAVNAMEYGQRTSLKGRHMNHLQKGFAPSWITAFLEVGPKGGTFNPQYASAIGLAYRILSGEFEEEKFKALRVLDARLAEAKLNLATLEGIAGGEKRHLLAAYRTQCEDLEKIVLGIRDNSLGEVRKLLHESLWRAGLLGSGLKDDS